ncbi:MAG: ChbG/HpnK family deacetylase [Rhodospirillaceae bacterium]
MRVTICADDYALTRPISAAILDLARAGRISAVSCMTTSRLWPELGPALKPLADKLDVGLHLTLVDEAPLTAMPRLASAGRLPRIGQLIAKSYLRRVPLDEIWAETDAQIAAFTAVMGRAPAHIDGHLHAHVLPGIRSIVLASAEKLSPRPWLRSTTDAAVSSRPAAFKAAVLNALGKGFARHARARGFVTNEGFCGFYDFARADYAEVFPAFLANLGPRPLILCHPGAAQDDVAWAAARAAEYEFLKRQTLLPAADIVRLSAH